MHIQPDEMAGVVHIVFFETGHIGILVLHIVPSIKTQLYQFLVHTLEHEIIDFVNRHAGFESGNGFFIDGKNRFVNLLLAGRELAVHGHRS